MKFKIGDLVKHNRKSMNVSQIWGIDEYGYILTYDIKTHLAVTHIPFYNEEYFDKIPS